MIDMALSFGALPPKDRSGRLVLWIWWSQSSNTRLMLELPRLLTVPRQPCVSRTVWLSGKAPHNVQIFRSRAWTHKRVALGDVLRHQRQRKPEPPGTIACRRFRTGLERATASLVISRRSKGGTSLAASTVSMLTLPKNFATMVVKRMRRASSIFRRQRGAVVYPAWQQRQHTSCRLARRRDSQD